MKLYGGDNTMIGNSHLNSFITSVMQGVVTLSRELSDGSLRYVVVYWIIAVLLIGEDPIPELIKIVQGLCQGNCSVKPVIADSKKLCNVTVR